MLCTIFSRSTYVDKSQHKNVNRSEWIIRDVSGQIPSPENGPTITKVCSIHPSNLAIEGPYYFLNFADDILGSKRGNDNNNYWPSPFTEQFSESRKTGE